MITPRTLYSEHRTYSIEQIKLQIKVHIGKRVFSELGKLTKKCLAPFFGLYRHGSSLKSNAVFFGAFTRHSYGPPRI